MSTREAISDLLKLDEDIDLVIPRGSNELVRSIKEQSKTIPVLGHAEGVCHVYVDKAADPTKAVQVKLRGDGQGWERSLLYICKGNYHIPSTSQKAGLTGLYKNFLLMSTTAISKPVLQEVNGTVILPLKYKGVSVPCFKKETF